MGHVAITGFRAFPGVERNPSQAVVEYLDQRPALLPQGSVLQLLDVDYRQVGAAIDALLESEPAAILLTGYSHLAAGITLETQATGICAAGKPDVAGHVPAAAATAPKPLLTALDLDHLSASILAAGLPCNISADAGEYVCNFSYRHALQRICDNGLSTQALFIHVPAVEGSVLAESAATSLPLQDMASAIATIAREVSAG